MDYANGVTISGFTVPALEVRKVKTDVELNEGQSFVIGGLLDNRVTQNLSKIPFLGDHSGKFFQSIDKKRTRYRVNCDRDAGDRCANSGRHSTAWAEVSRFVSASNSNIPMSNPGSSVTGGQPLPAAPATIPVEELIQSMKAEKPLSEDKGQSSSMGGASPPSGSQ